MSTVNIIDFIYLISAMLFMLGIKNLSSPATAKLGNKMSMCGMGVAILATLASPDMFGYTHCHWCSHWWLRRGKG